MLPSNVLCTLHPSVPCGLDLQGDTNQVHQNHQIRASLQAMRPDRLCSTR